MRRRRNLAERIGAGIFLVGISLAGYAIGIYQHPRPPVWAGGRLSGVLVAAGGLVIWAIGRIRSRRTEDP